MSKLLYPIYKMPSKSYGRNIPNWIKYWLYTKAFIESTMELSEILTGSSFTLIDSVRRKFNLFEIGGNTEQTGTPTTENPVEIQNVVGTIVNKISNEDETQEQTANFTLEEGEKLFFGDTLEDDGKHHKKKEIVLDGTENWEYEASAITPTNRTVIKVLLNIAIKNQNYLSNYFIKDSQTSNRLVIDIPTLNTAIIYISLDDAITGIETTDSNETKVLKMKTWLNGHNVTLNYELLHEQIVPYNSTQQTQYNNLKNLKTYNGITNISSESDELSPILNIQYYKKKGANND